MKGERSQRSLISFCQHLPTKTFKMMDLRFRLAFPCKNQDLVLEIKPEDEVSETFARVEQKLKLPRDSLKFTLDGEALDKSLRVCETEIISESIIDVEMKKSYLEYLEAKKIVPDLKGVEYSLNDSDTRDKIEKIVKTYSSWDFYVSGPGDYFSDKAKKLISEKLLRETIKYSHKKCCERLAVLVRLASAYEWHPFLMKVLSEATHTSTLEFMLENIPKDVFSELSFDSSIMVRSVECGGVSTVKKLLELGANPNSYRNDNPAIAVATEKRNIEMIQLLLEHGADIDLKTKRKGLTPLMIASRDGNIDIVKFFLDAGADINAVNHNGNNALKVAVQSGQIDVVKEIIKRNSILNDQSWSPLRLAINHSRVGIAMICFDHNQYKDADLFDFLIYISEIGDFETFDKVVSKVDKKEVEYCGDQLLIELIQKREYKYVKCLLDHGFDVNVRYRSKPALLYALEESTGMVDLILESGQTLKLDEKIFNFLYEDDNIRDYFCDGYDFNTVFADGSTLLISIVFLEQENRERCSSCHDSESEHEPEPEENTEYIDFLIERCDPNLRSGEGISPAEYAANNGMPYLFKCLIKKNACIDFSKIEVYRLHDYSIIKHLIGLGLEVRENTSNILNKVLLNKDYKTAKLVLTKTDKFCVDESIYKLSSRSCDRELMNALLDRDSNMSEPSS